MKNLMTNLFSIFDPFNSLNYCLNWLSIFIPILIMPNQFWMKYSKFMMIWITINNFLFKEFSVFKNKKIFNISNLMILFFLISMSNFIGLFPYIFTPSSHMSMSLPIALTLWLGIINFNWTKKTNQSLAHLVPLSTPSLLMMFMVIIELISNIIRPLTLAIRLSANMIAGHLLLCLLGSSGPSCTNMMIFIVTLTEITLYTLEMAVSIIQAYVFMTLLSLYSNEL